MSPVMFGDHQQAGRVLVEPVHDARSPLAAYAGQAVAAMGDQGVDQRAILIAGGRVNNHAGGLVDHNQVVVLIDDIERY